MCRLITGGSCRELAFDSNELWLQVYKDHHGDALRRLGVSRVSRQQSNPRFAFFKRILDRQQYLVRLFLLLASKDFNDNVRKFVHTMEALKFSSKDINCKYQCFENSDLMCVCARFKRWRCLKYLVTLGGSLSTGGDSRGCSPLLVAAWTGNVSMVRYILTTITSSKSTQCLYQEISRKGRYDVIYMISYVIFCLKSFFVFVCIPDRGLLVPVGVKGLLILRHGLDENF